MPTKPLVQSKTFWSDVVTLIVGALTLVDHYAGTHILSSSWAGTILGLAGAFGIYGRATADTQISGVI